MRISLPIEPVPGATTAGSPGTGKPDVPVDAGPFRLTPGEIGPAARLLARAFQDDPILSRCFPDAPERRRKLPKLFEVLIACAISDGHAHTTSACLEGIAVWEPARPLPQTAWRQGRGGGWSLVSALGIGSLIRQAAVTRYLYRVERRVVRYPHVRLAWIAVDPELRGRGHAGRLIRPMLAAFDRDGLTCYLESQTTESASFHEHFGFRIMHEGMVPGTDIRNRAMLRPPGR